MKNPLTTVLPQRLRRQMPNALQTMREMENDMERWFRQSPFALDWPDDYDRLDFAPACNIKETDASYKLAFDIPGIKKKDVKIEVENNRLTVSGERKEEKEERSDRRFLSESYFGSFTRSFTLPSAVNEDKVDAHYEDGVLTVTIPKMKVTKAKQIEIH